VEPAQQRCPDGLHITLLRRHTNGPCLQEAEELQREMQALEAERAGLLRAVRLKEEMEQQYAKRGTLQVGDAGQATCGSHCRCGASSRRHFFDAGSAQAMPL
jgi:hypothetical protein